jgi:hypothetical protein
VEQLKTSSICNTSFTWFKIQTVYLKKKKPVIPVTQEVDAGGLRVQGQLGQN